MGDGCVRDTRCCDSCCECRDDGCGTGSGNFIWILVIGYLLLCNTNGRGGGGLFGGLF